MVKRYAAIGIHLLCIGSIIASSVQIQASENTKRYKMTCLQRVADMVFPGRPSSVAKTSLALLALSTGVIGVRADEIRCVTITGSSSAKKVVLPHVCEFLLPHYDRIAFAAGVLSVASGTHYNSCDIKLELSDCPRYDRPEGADPRHVTDLRYCVPASAVQSSQVVTLSGAATSLAIGHQ